MGYKLKIASPEKIIYEDEAVDFISLPGELGGFGVLNRHTPLLSALKEGKIIISKGQQTQDFDIGGGFAEILPDKATVLVRSKLKPKTKDDKNKS